MSERITVAETVGRVIAQRGAGHVFAVVGSGNYHVTNALIDGGLGFTAARHEMGAASMADAYTRVSGRVAVVSVHQGCGLSNAITGIGEASKSNTPLLVVSGDTAAGDTASNFDIDQDALVTAVGAVAERVHGPRSAIRDAARAFDTAVARRVPVVLSLPVDVQDELVEWDAGVVPAPVSLVPGSGGAAGITELVRLIDAADRPVIVGGRGARAAGMLLRDLAAEAGALLVASGGARGLFEGDPWALDVMGGYATEGAAELIRDADLIVGFGVAFNNWTARGGYLTERAKLVQVDDRPSAIGRHRPVALGIVGDAAAVADATLEALRAVGAVRPRYRTPEVAERVAVHRSWCDQPVEPVAEVGVVDPALLTNALDALLPRERVVVPDGGNVNCYAGAHLRVPDDSGYCLPLSFQAIGLGLASAIGAGVAAPHRLPVLGTGDGSFLMSCVELETAVRLGLGMLVVVFNDSAYGAEVHLYRDEVDRHGIVHFPDTDIAEVARGYGCDALTVRSLDDLDGVESWLGGPRDRPLVLDAKISGRASWLMARRFAAAGSAH